MKHVIVTGGAGFIGSHLVDRLLLEGKTVIVIDDLSTGSVENLSVGKSSPRLRIIKDKVSACVELPQLVEQAESIYHLAAAVGVELVLSSPVRTLRTNLHDTEIILKSASAFKVPVLLTSSSEVYGRSQRNEFSEVDDLIIGPPTLPRWSYACSKLMDEFLAMSYAREHGLSVTIARLFNTVGPRQTGRYGMVLPRFIAAAQAGQPLRVFGNGRQTRCFCHVSDAVEALVRLQNSSASRGHIFNIGSAEEISILDLAKLVIATLRSPSTIEIVPYFEAYGPDFEDMLRRKPDVRKLQATIDYAPSTPLAQIIESTAHSQS